MKIAALCGVYLAAIVAANLSLAHWGPKVAVINGSFFVALDLVTRDVLHDRWRGHLVRNMGLLIVTGSVLSYVMAKVTTPEFLNVGRIAFASCVAFAAAAAVDALIYQRLRDRPWMERANQSNIGGSAVDSVVFIPIAIGWEWLLMFSLFAAKVGGGVVWSFLFAKGADGRAWMGRHKERYAQ